ncbi:Na(+)/H(+) antiporter NhaA 3 [Bienertia sinuspersici]
MDVWSWICDLPNSPEWSQSNSQLTYQLASSNSSAQSIHFKAEQSSELKPEIWITFSVYIEGFHSDKSKNILWLSDPCSLSSDKPFMPLILQLVQEIINHAPITYHEHIHHGPQKMKVKPDPIVWVLETFSPESFSSFFSLLLFTRLFWLCACDAPSEVGALFFHSLFAPNLELLSRASHVPVLKGFMRAVGVDIELCISRAFGYMLVKWLITREVRVGLPSILPLPSNNLGISYASQACNLWSLKGYAPVWAMKRTCCSDTKEGFHFVGHKESALRYSLAHQQLEAHIQLEYNVVFFEGYIQVSARVDNIRLHMVKLGFNNDNDVEFNEELYFPSRVKFWVGPEIGSSYVTSLSLGKSVVNTEREVETQKTVKGNFGKTKIPKVKTTSRTSTKMKMKNWRCDQDVEGNVAIFDAVFYENTNGIEVYNAKLIGGGGTSNKPKDDLGKRYSRVNRPFMKSGGLVFTRNGYGEEVKWRLSKEMEGSVLKWRFGSKIWVTYWPSDVESSYYETRCIELCDEVDLPLISNVSS